MLLVASQIPSLGRCAYLVSISMTHSRILRNKTFSLCGIFSFSTTGIDKSLLLVDLNQNFGMFILHPA